MKTIQQRYASTITTIRTSRGYLHEKKVRKRSAAQAAMFEEADSIRGDKGMTTRRVESGIQSLLAKFLP